LHAHVARRHPESARQAVPAPATRPLYAEAVPVSNATPPAASRARVADAEFARELEEIRERLQNTEAQLVEERNSRNELLRKVAASFILKTRLHQDTLLLLLKMKRLEWHYTRTLQGHFT